MGGEGSLKRGSLHKWVMQPRKYGILFLRFILLFNSVSLCGYVNMSAGDYGDQRCQMLVELLGTKLWSSLSTAHTLKAKPSL